MTSHDTALEAAAAVISTARKTLAPAELADLVLSAYISTVSQKYEPCSSCNGSGLALNGAGEPDECRECSGNTVVPASPDLSGLVERLRKDIAVDPNVALTPVDRLRLLAFVDSEDSIASFDADDAEYIVEGLEAMADALTALSLQLAAVEGERNQLIDENFELRDVPWPSWALKVLAVIRERSGYDGYDDAGEGVDLPAELDECLSELEAEADRNKARAETAEASLTLAQEENERLRAALEPFADVADFMDSETEGFSMDDELWLGISNDEFPPCHIKNFALQLFYTARATLSTPSKGNKP